MKYLVKADTMVIFNGKLMPIKAGELDTADKDLCDLLDKVKGVEKCQPKKTVKSKEE